MWFDSKIIISKFNLFFFYSKLILDIFYTTILLIPNQKSILHWNGSMELKLPFSKKEQEMIVQKSMLIINLILTTSWGWVDMMLLQQMEFLLGIGERLLETASLRKKAYNYLFVHVSNSFEVACWLCLVSCN